MKTILIALQCLLYLYHPSIAQDNSFLNKYSHAGDHATSPLPAVVTSRIIWSEKVNDDFKIFISLPPHYDSLRLEKYPVVYFLDGGSSTFHNINAEYMDQGLIPEVITIGIGYPGATQRDRDYTYGFIDFYQFLKQELIPQMEKEFHINPYNRTLFGHSYGGICVLFSMFEYYDWEDILFRNLIAASPSIWYDSQIAFTRERTLYGETHILPVNLYMSVGSMEGFMVADMNRMQQTLMGHNYDYFLLSCHVYEGKNHSTNKEITYREGIQWVLDQEIRFPITADPEFPSPDSIALGIYPNPATDQIHLMLSPYMSQPVACSIKDINGKEIKRLTHQNTSQQLLKIQVSDFPKGFYVVHLSNGTRYQILKFIK